MAMWNSGKTEHSVLTENKKQKTLWALNLIFQQPGSSWYDGWRYENTWSETKDFTLMAQQAWFLLSPTPTKVMWRVPSRCCTHTAFMSQLRDPELRKPGSFIIRSKQTCVTIAPSGDIIFIILGSMQTCPLFQKETLPLSFKVVSYTYILGNIVQNKNTCRTCRNTTDPWKIVSWKKKTTPEWCCSKHSKHGSVTNPRESPVQKCGNVSAGPSCVLSCVSNKQDDDRSREDSPRPCLTWLLRHISASCNLIISNQIVTRFSITN